MKKTVFILFLSFILMGCAEKEIVFPEARMTFNMQVEGEKDSVFTPYVTLVMDTNECMFFYDVASSDMGIGTFELKDNVLTLKGTDDVKTENSVFVFKVIDEYTIEFVAEESSEPRLYDKRNGIVPEDGARFVAEKE